MKARFIQEIGTRASLRIYWSRVRLAAKACTSCMPPCGTTYMSRERLEDGTPCSYHDARTPIAQDRARRRDIIPADLFGKPEDFAGDPRWPIACAACGMPVPTTPAPAADGEEGWDVTRQVFAERLYDSPSGEPEAGDIFFTEFHEPGACLYWDNCDGRHLYARVPNGEHWDIDSRASNCTMREDRTHRCWVRTGRPEDGTIDVGKGGITCSAGAGSIQTARWHGFLRNGIWVQC